AIPPPSLHGPSATRYRSSDTAIPLMPPKPSPPPPAPSAVAPAVGSASVSVMPSAPVPLSIVASKSTVTALDDNAVGQNPEPAELALFGVSWSCVPTMDAAPFSCHPPLEGSFTGPLGGGGVGPAVPDT